MNKMIRWLREMLRVWLRRAALASTFGVLRPLGDLERRRQAKVYPWDRQCDES
jgi:hypothetical protein